MRWVVVVACAACGRIGFDPRDGGERSDAESLCEWGPFAAPVPLPGAINSTADDWSPAPTRGGLEVYFYSYRPPNIGAAIWRASRPTLADPFAAAAQVAEVEGMGQQERAPVLSDDALDLVFERDPVGNGDLFETTRATTNDTFAPPVPLAAVNSATTDADPWLSADGLRLVFASSRIGPNQHGLDMFETTRPDRASPFAPPVELHELDSDDDDFSPTLSADGREIFFASRRAGGRGGADIYTARRAAPGQPFGPPRLVPELSSPMDDVGTRLSVDGATLYLNYNARANGGANADLASATRRCD